MLSRDRDPGSSQLYTPVTQRRVVRRATPATLTGVRGRPTLASTVGTSFVAPGIESLSPIAGPKIIAIPVINRIPNILNRLILPLLF